MRSRGIGLATVLVLAGAVGCSGGDDPVVHTAEQSYDVTEPVTTVLLDARMASVTVDAADGPVTVTETLRYSGTKPTVSHQIADGALQLTETGCGGARLRCDVDYRIRVPARTALRVTTTAGAVTVRGLAGQLVVSSDAGAINGQELTADRATVSTRAGAAKLQFAEPPAQVEATSELGAIEVRLPGDRSYAVNVSTKAGGSDVSVDQDAASAHKITVKTTVGAVRVAPNTPN